MARTDNLRRKLLFINMGGSNEPLALESVKGFFGSSIGGGWRESEIAILASSSISKASIVLQVASANQTDYCLVLCLGKIIQAKRDRPWVETFVVLPNGEYISERELNPGCSRLLLIFDGGRCGPLGATEGDIQEVSAGERFSVRRRAYDDAIMTAEGGGIKLSYQSPEQDSADDFSLFEALAQIAEDWAETNSGVLTLDQALEQLRQRSGFEKRAIQYSAGRRLRHFPWSVS